MNELIALAAQRGLPIQLVASAQAQAQCLAERVAKQLQSAINQRGRASLALSGGRSPVPFLGAGG